jgi:conjugal transfer pilus assembly protein TraD
MDHRRRYEQALIERESDPAWILHGIEEASEPIHISRDAMDQHLLIGGTTGCGKTRLLELLALQAVRAGETVIVIDPKGDRDLLDRVYACAERSGRADRFLFFSLPHPRQSVTYNPLAEFRQPREIADRIAALLPSTGDAMPFRNFAWDIVHRVAQALQDAGLPMTVAQIRASAFEQMESLAQKLPRHRSAALRGLLSHPRDHYMKMASSLIPVLTRLSSGPLRKLLSPSEPELAWSRAEGGVVYFYLGSMLGGDSAQAVAKLALLDFQAFLGRRYAEGRPAAPISLFVDEFSDLAMPEFIGVLNKSRGAGVSIALATQTFSDLEATLGSEARAMQILGNASTLVQFRSGNEQDARLFSRLVGREPAQVVSTGQSYEPAFLSSGSRWIDDFRAVYSTRVETRDEELLPPHYPARLGNLHALARIEGRLFKILVPVVSGNLSRRFSERLS